MPDRPYDPDHVLDGLPNKGAAVRKAIDWWLADVAPKLPGLKLILRLDEPSDPMSARPVELWLRMTSAHLMVAHEISGIVASRDGDQLAAIIVGDLDGMHRKLIDLARQDAERWRGSVRNARSY